MLSPCICCTGLQTAAGGEDGGKKRKSKKDKRDKQQQERGSSRSKRMRQPAAEEADAGSKRVRPSGPELPEDAYEETAEDKNFIDDDGGSSTLYSL